MACGHGARRSLDGSGHDLFGITALKYDYLI
jgi:hypothetical protein